MAQLLTVLTMHYMQMVEMIETPGLGDLQGHRGLTALARPEKRNDRIVFQGLSDGLMQAGACD